MSTTRTSLYQQDHLRDYTIQLTGGENASSATSQSQPAPSSALASTPSPSVASEPETENPPNWYAAHRDVPPHRPVNTQLDRESRPWGSNPVESVIIYTMMHGVWLKSSVAWLWRQTGGRFNDEAFSTTIGGES